MKNDEHIDDFHEDIRYVTFSKRKTTTTKDSVGRRSSLSLEKWSFLFEKTHTFSDENDENLSQRSSSLTKILFFLQRQRQHQHQHPPKRLSLNPATGGHVADGPRPAAGGVHSGTTPWDRGCPGRVGPQHDRIASFSAFSWPAQLASTEAAAAERSADEDAALELVPQVSLARIRSLELVLQRLRLVLEPLIHSLEQAPCR